jgi:hypothetical protein
MWLNYWGYNQGVPVRNSGGCIFSGTLSGVMFRGVQKTIILINLFIICRLASIFNKFNYENEYYGFYYFGFDRTGGRNP